MDILDELHALRRDIADLGGAVAAGLLHQAERCFLAWKFEVGGCYMEHALVHFQYVLGQRRWEEAATAFFDSCARASPDARALADWMPAAR